MRTIVLLLLASLPFVGSAQQAIIAEDFESYTPGDLLAYTSPLWTTWSGGVITEDGYISNTYAISGSNSLNVVGYNGPTDLILPFPQDYTSGVYEFSLKMYITSGNGGYFNIQASSVPQVAWMFEIYFDSTGGGYISAGGAMAATFTYSSDTWMSINVRANLDNDLGECFLNSHLIHSWQWSTGALGASSINQIGGVDIYSYSADSSDANMFIDDVLLTKITTTGIIVEDFEKNTSGQLLAANSDLWSTWDGQVDSQDAFVSNAYANNGFNSVHILGNDGPTDLILPFPQDYTSGVIEFGLKMYIVNGYGAYFNMQQSSVPGLGWMFEVYFDDVGGGYINAGALNAATVSYTPETWFDISLQIDLTNDLAELFIDSNSIYTWQWSLGFNGLGTTNSVGGVDIWGSGDSTDANFYVDDVLLTSTFGTYATAETFSPDIFIFPNPSNGQFTVMINDLPAGDYQIQLVDVLGHIISSEILYIPATVIKNFETKLSDGIYYVRLIDGKKVTTKKIIVN